MSGNEETYRSKKDFFDKLNESYDQIQQISSGGGGIIYQGIHRRLKEKVVLKKIRSDKVSIIGSEREMKILMSLKHTYLPRIYDFWHYEDEVYTVMEFIEGKSFQELLDAGRTFREKDVIRWTRQLAEVLEYLHNSEQHIVHSDIKPANLMLTPKGDICLIDFNVSLLQGGEADATIGYSEYYAPVEQLIWVELARQRSMAQPAVKKEPKKVAKAGSAGSLTGGGDFAGAGFSRPEMVKNNGARLTRPADDDTDVGGNRSDDSDTYVGGGSADEDTYVGGNRADDGDTYVGGGQTDEDTYVGGSQADDGDTYVGGGRAGSGETEATEAYGGPAYGAPNGARGAAGYPPAQQPPQPQAVRQTQTGRTQTGRTLSGRTQTGRTLSGRTQTTPQQTGMSMREFRSQKAREMMEIYGKKLKVDERSDIYSACATMYHILTGRRPAPCYMALEPVETVMPSVNDAFAQILTRGLQQDPKKRYKNVSQMLKALRRLGKLTKSYKRLLHRQDFVLILLLVIFLGSAGATYVGWGMSTEGALEEKIAAAQEYYADGQYQEGLDYLEQNILANPLYQNSGQISEGHYLAAGCYLELGELSEAVGEYQRAIFLDNTQPVYYRDYGIALARSGNLQQAREALLQAQARGLESSSLKLLEGEIASLEEDYRGAASALRECLEDTDDDSIVLRAALKLDEVLAADGGDEAYPERIQVLEDARKRLPKERLLMLLQRLTQVYGDYGQLSGDTSYTEKAVDALSEIIDMGYGTMVEWLDKAVYLQSLGRYGEAEECLLEADETYPDNYLIYKRLAFLELEVPDYEKFDTYFKRCKELYEKLPSGTEQDMEMGYLYQIYDEVVVKGWLEG